MKFSKLFTKIVAGSAMSIMLMSTAAMATTITTTYTVPSYSYTENWTYEGRPLVTPSMTAYADMVVKANKTFEKYGTVIVDGFLKKCISSKDMDKAISAAKKAASYMDDIVFYETGNVPYTNLFDGSIVGGKVRFTGVTASQLRDKLEDASIGGVNWTLKTKSTSIPDYYANAYVDLSLDAISGDFYSYYLFYFDTIATPLTDDGVRTDMSLTKMKSKLNNYADLLTAVKNYYAQACNVTADVATTTDKTTKDKSTKNAVITAKDKTIKLNSSFNLKAAGVTATDNNGKGKDLTSKITQTGKVDTSKAGTFKVTYYVIGANGVKVSKTVTYTVK